MYEILLKNICENPREESFRLGLADWFEENNLIEKAQFIRAQCSDRYFDSKMVWIRNSKEWLKEIEAINPEFCISLDRSIKCTTRDIHFHPIMGLFSGLSCSWRKFLDIEQTVIWVPGRSREFTARMLPIQEVHIEGFMYPLASFESLDLLSANGHLFSRFGCADCAGTSAYCGSCIKKPRWVSYSWPQIQFTLPKPD